MVTMTVKQARKLYLSVDPNPAFCDTLNEWAEIHREMIAVISAPTDRSAGRLIDWWGCWSPRFTATAFARRLRVTWRQWDAAALARRRARIKFRDF